jgi:hypothetical protein
MFCHNCGASQTDNPSFCAQCGARQTPEDAEVGASDAGAPSIGSSLSGSAANDAAPAGVTRATRTDERPRRSRVGIAVLWLITIAWVSLVSLHAYANWPRFSQLGANGLWDFLIRALAPIVLFWLVMGYLQLASKLRQSAALNAQAARLVGDTEKAAALVSGLVKQAQAALHRVETEVEKLRDQEKGRLRAVQPRWEVNGRIAHEKVHEINLRNAGAAATGLSVVCDKSLPIAVILSETNFVDRGATLTIKAMFLEERRDAFELTLHYTDGANEPRVAHIVVSNIEVAIKQDEV